MFAALGVRTSPGGVTNSTVTGRSTPSQVKRDTKTCKVVDVRGPNTQALAGLVLSCTMTNAGVTHDSAS